LANSFFDLWTLEPIVERIDQQLQAYEHLPSKTAKAVIQTETSPDLTFQDFSFGYDVGEPLIQNLTYRLDFGSIHLICGLNGSGKTTLLKCCAGFWKPDQGQIKLGNLSSSDSNYADEVGFCPADNWRLPSADLETNLNFFKVTNQQSDPAEHQYTIHSWLDELKQIDPEHYSRGQARKLTLLRFFSHQRQVYLLDEPCENLDDKARDALIQTCQKLSEKHIVVVASHHPQWKKSGHKEVPWS
jgi:ABC-type multidrug transport system ATPase subunit